MKNVVQAMSTGVWSLYTTAILYGCLKENASCLTGICTAKVISDKYLNNIKRVFENYQKNLVLYFLIFSTLFAQSYACNCDRLLVQFLLRESLISYFYFLDLVTRHSVALSSTTQYIIYPSILMETVYLSTSFPDTFCLLCYMRDTAWI